MSPSKAFILCTFDNSAKNSRDEFFSKSCCGRLTLKIELADWRRNFCHAYANFFRSGFGVWGQELECLSEGAV